MKVLATFIRQLMSNHTKMVQGYMEINGNFQFSQIWHDETFEALF